MGQLAYRYASVAWIDTEGTFRGDRIIEIANRWGAVQVQRS
jgi:hypothetical protein